MTDEAPEVQSESYDQVLLALRSRRASLRNHIERALNGEFKRPDVWFHEQTRMLRLIARAGAWFRYIAAYPESFDAWKAAMPPIKVTDAEIDL